MDSPQSIFQRIASVLSGTKPEPSTVTFPTHKRKSDEFYVDASRNSIINDCRRMYDEDPRIKSGLWRIAGDMVAGSFSVHVKSGPYSKRAQKIADDVLEKLELRTPSGQAGSKLISTLVYAMRDGDVFLQVVASNNGIQELLKMPLMSNDLTSYSSHSKGSYTVFHRNSNTLDKFDNPRKAYFMSNFPIPENTVDPKSDTITWFRDWQILHVRWWHEATKRYGTPLMASSRITYKMLKEGEVDVAVRRKTRAGQKRHHQIQGATDAAIEEYKKWNADALDDPTAAASDFFSNERTTISVLQGDETIGQIDDLVHHLQTLATGMLIPLAMTGYGSDMNRDILDVQNEEYRRLLEVIGTFPISAIIKPIIELEWLLHGIYPDSYDWDIEWSSRESWRLNADGLFKLYGMVSPEYWTLLASKILPNFQPDQELEFIKKSYDQDKKNKQDAQKPVKQANQDEPGRKAIT